MYFEQEGTDNTGKTLEAAVAAAKERGLTHIVAASCTGRTARLLADTAASAGYGGGLVCVTHAYGFAEKGANEMSGDVRRELEARGLGVYTAAHALSGTERGISRRFQGVYPVEIIAHALRMFGQGLKVCVEVSVMALDGGLIPFGVPVVAVGGTMKGADTAVILTPGHGNGIFDTRIHEIICKPL